jgi:selenocysteine lyase/cysteine desulfurase
VDRIEVDSVDRIEGRWPRTLDTFAPMPIDVAQARALTPGCAHVVHFNNAGASLMPVPVIDAVKDFLDIEARIGGYEAMASEAHRWERAYDAIAELINCTRAEVALAENASRAWEMAFHSVKLGPGDRVLADRAAYISCWLAFLLVQQRTGCRVEVVPDDAHGQLDVEALRRMMDGRVKLVAVTHVPTSNGLVNPVEAVGAVVRGSDALYLVDACQSVGQLPVDVERIGCDMLSSTGRKYLRGPRGSGFLYVRRSVLHRLEPPFVEQRGAIWESRDTFRWRDDALRFETWEKSLANVAGLAAAVDHALHWGIEAIAARTVELAARFRAQLAELPGITVHDTGLHRSGIVTFTRAGTPARSIMAHLAAQGINTVVSEAANAKLDLEARGIGPVVRASVHYYNTGAEVDQVVRAVAACPA